MTSNPSTIQVSPQTQSQHGNWSPVQGSALTDLLEANTDLSPEEKERLVRETTSILSGCTPPTANDHVNTGLVIGHVQSGKTLSFTALTALARDNGYQLVILLAGTTNNLVEQSFSRLKSDLRHTGAREWNVFTTQQKSFQKSEVSRVNKDLAAWRRNSDRARTIIIVSMKQHQHLDNLAKLLANSDFSDVPTLIIDDEGDQAGLNTKAKSDDESTTYSRIKNLRALFPQHSYVLYTATPQAPLLISRIDALSPDFGRVLTPGESYTGGQEFFVDGQQHYIELIPSSDVPDKDDPPQHPPESLKDALRDFFIGVAIGFEEGEFKKGRNRSMMIHPAVGKDDHLMYARWTKQIQDQWVSILKDPGHPEHQRLLSAFEAAALDLLKTYDTSLTFEDIAPVLFEAIEETTVAELNTREKSRITPVDWDYEYSWILVGGIGLDRGFTVEGLTVSYMPRSTGVGNADNIQQRARFFGYKRPYLGLCRIYLTEENIDAFTDYVRHEEAIRNSIRNHLNSGKTLKDWRRTYPLDAKLKPTRSSVILLEMYQSKGKGGWIVPDHPFDDPEIVSENRDTVDEIFGSFDFSPYAEDGWNETQTIPKFSNSIHLRDLLPMIGQFRYKWPDDTLSHGALMLSLERMIDDTPDMLCSFYAFSGPWSGVDSKRTLTKKEPAKIRALLQGANPRTNYPGASSLVSSETVTFQLHRYDIQTADKKRSIRDVPILATHIPDPLMERLWIER